MRLGLIRLGVLVAGLLATALAFASGASAAGHAAEPRPQFSFRTHADGFRIEVNSIEMKGRQGVYMAFRRHHQFAEYGAPAKISESTVKVKFGTLGELDYSFAPKGSSDAECFGAEGSEAAFTGAFTFTGEDGFIHIDADHATGFYKVEPEPSGCRARRSDRPVAARAAPFQRYVGDGATLFARTAWKRTDGVSRLREVGVDRGKTAKQASVSAALVEVQRGLSIVRGAEINAPAHAFEWDFGTGTATLAPPAPFAGTASFTREPDGLNRFTGSLKAPIPGIAKPISMAGAEFNAKLTHGTPNEP